MKKLSVLVALMLIITVGGVYANWNYYAYVTGTATPGADTIEEIDLALKVVAGEDSSTPKGTIRVTLSDDFKITIDDNSGDHVGEFDVTGYITVHFDPAANAKDDVKTNGIPMLFELSCEGLPGFLTPAIGSINNDDPTTEFTITADAIETLLAQRWTVNLPTPSAYDTFAATLASKTITVTVYENVDDGVSEGDPG